MARVDPADHRPAAGDSMSDAQPRLRSLWTLAWFGWLVLFLSLEVPAAINHTGGTLSETVWTLWFPFFLERCILGAFLLVLIAHFLDKGRHWWSGGRAVIWSGMPVCGIIVWHERGAGWTPVWIVLAAVALVLVKEITMGGFFAKVWGGLKSAGGWVMRHGPVVASGLTGLALAVPGAAPALNAIAGLLASSSGGSVDADLVKQIGELITGVVFLVGTARKVYAKVTAPTAVSAPAK